MIDDSMRQRQDLVIEFMKLGMDFDTACTASEVSPEMKAQFIEDEDFIARKKFAISQVEVELLKRLQKASEFSSMKGDTRATERLLELIRPERYAKTTKIQLPTDDKAPKGFAISFVSSSVQPCEEEEPELVKAEG